MYPSNIALRRTREKADLDTLAFSEFAPLLHCLSDSAKMILDEQ